MHVNVQGLSDSGHVDCYSACRLSRSRELDRSGPSAGIAIAQTSLQDLYIVIGTKRLNHLALLLLFLPVLYQHFSPPTLPLLRIICLSSNFEISRNL